MIIKGKAKIIKSLNDYYLIRESVILVAQNTHPDIVVTIKNISAIITEIDNKLCHAAIIAREYNIPLLMGISKATKKFKNGEKIALDLNKKTVYKIK